jgi:hypothetical protein
MSEMMVKDRRRPFRERPRGRRRAQVRTAAVAILTAAVGLGAGLAAPAATAVEPARVLAHQSGLLPGSWRPGVLGGNWGADGFGKWLPATGPVALAAAPGSAWRMQPSPNPVMRNGSLAADSCTGPAACTAVGGYENQFGTGLTLAERWDGRTWNLQDTATPAGAVWSGLAGVSCATATACAAVGWYVTPVGRLVALAERWDGQRWAVEPVASPVGSVDSGLFGISCTAPRSCTAVGEYVTRAGAALALAERWDGQRWVVQPTPALAGSQRTELSGVSCVSVASCTAAGAYATKTTQVTLAERWNGANWRTEATPNPAGSLGAGFTAISCSAARACTAVGSYGAPSAGARPTALAEAWDGTSWHIQSAPGPTGTIETILFAVSCASPAACTATGGSEPSSDAGLEVSLAESWDGTRWTIQATPNPANSIGTGLSGVSCVSADACDSVGSYDVQLPIAVVAGEPIPAVTLAEAWNGTRWAVRATPDQRGAVEYSELSGASCTSARACAGVGDYLTSAGLFAPLAERWNGRGWAIQPIPNPAANMENFLYAVSCSSARACTTVGFSTSISGTSALAESWNGTRWRIQPAPRPAHPTRLFGVSCPSARSCMAVGDHLKGPVPLAEEWNGTSWRILTVPAPADAAVTVLSGVSCSSAHACTAVGSYTTTAGLRRALAES